MDSAQVSPRRLPWLPDARLALALAAYIGLLILLYHRAMFSWYVEWTMNGSYYAHGVFVPFFVAAMIWRDREKIRRIPVERCWWGLAPIILAALLMVHAYRAEVTMTHSISFMLMLIGTLLLATGWKMTRLLLLPVLFLVTMIPFIPNQVISRLAFPIQLMSAKMASSLLSVTGFGNTRYGTQIEMEHYTLNVEVPCSGFKTLVGLMSFSGAFAYLVEAAMWKRWFLFLLAVPLAIVVNGVRITLIGLVGELFSSKAASSFHDWSGFLVLILGFMVLFGSARLLRCETFYGIPLNDPPPGEHAPDPPMPEEREAALNRQFGPPVEQSAQRLTAGLVPVLGVMACMALIPVFVGPIVATHPIMRVNQVPISLDGGAWTRLGDDVPITKDVQDTLQPDVYLERIYVAKPPATGLIGLFITGGNSRHTFHDPHDCFVGSGLLLDDGPVTKIETSAGSLWVQEATATDPRAHTKELLFFVFVVDGKLYHTLGEVHEAIVRQTFFGSDGYPFYLVRLRQMVKGTDPARREELIRFAKALWPVIGPIMTPSAQNRR
jgi:exosortase